jgi:cellulose synthase/poly-beta-1,6-N-acetylglucosamine synthase-like glycosyltransferase
MSAASPTPTVLQDEESARITFWRRQVVSAALLVLLVALFLVVRPVLALNLVVTVAILGYLASGIYKIYVLYEAARHGTPYYPPSNAADADLPSYTILVPLYRETEVLPGLLDGLRALDFPADRLQVLLLLEEDDEEMIDACAAARLPAHVTPLVVPQGYPKTKPRACNHGLAAAGGEYLVIFDAEDRPEPDQLRKAVSAFAAAPPEVICQQAKLGYYNQRQNAMTRFFTIDYANWFDGILPGLTRLRAPIPLGGTSNHFRTDALRALGGWDPYNVAEDADLGIRLARHGYRTAIFDSVTWEEANSRVRSWIRQRSRWVKGYMQTLLVHTRRPRLLRRQLGTGNMLSFLALIGGTPLSSLLNPIFWLLGIAYYVTRSTAIEALFLTPVYYMGLVCFVAGNFIFIYMNVFTAVRWGYDDLAKWALLTPFYWILLSLASYKALYELITRPHYWQKTTHGLGAPSAQTGAALRAAQANAGRAGGQGGP